LTGFVALVASESLENPSPLYAIGFAFLYGAAFPRWWWALVFPWVGVAITAVHAALQDNVLGVDQDHWLAIVIGMTAAMAIGRIARVKVATPSPH
jgi:hypothetical protein